MPFWLRANRNPYRAFQFQAWDDVPKSPVRDSKRVGIRVKFDSAVELAQTELNERPDASRFGEPAITLRVLGIFTCILTSAFCANTKSLATVVKFLMCG